MRTTEFTKTDTEDIEYVILKVEKSLDIKFDDLELLDVKTYGELNDRIIRKIKKEHQEDCTSKQAFYKLRKIISTNLNIDSKNINPQTVLTDILPKKTRKQKVKEIENSLGFNINILRPKKWITTSLTILILSSLICFLYDWKIAITGLILSLIGFKIAYKLGKTLDLNTISELVEKMTRDNYINSRRNKETFNKTEIERIIKKIFSEHLGISQNELTADALIEK